MQVKPANRLQGIGEYYFSKKLREIDALNAAGEVVINLGIGSPDLPPHPDVILELQQQAARPDMHGYQSYRGAEKFRCAVSRWYQTWYGVSLDPASEILPLVGSKEGIMHICMTYLNQGDIVLIPNPGYPTYSSTVQLAGGICREYLLDADHNYYPDYAELEASDLSKVKLMFVNYPHMPTGEPADPREFRKIIDFALRHRILVIHDNPYSFILNESPLSLLSIEGANEVVIELNSLSKSHNMAGWRMGFLCGARQHIDQVLRFKSNMDSGMFLPAQMAAARALTLDKSWHDEVNVVYRNRRSMAQQLSDLLGCTYSERQEGMFLWAKVPGGYRNGFDLSEKVLRDSRVFITPGGIFGSAGDQHIRISLCSPVEKFETSIQRIENGGY